MQGGTATGSHKIPFGFSVVFFVCLIFFVCLFVVCLFGGGCGGFLLVKSRGQTGKNTLSKFVTE